MKKIIVMNWLIKKKKIVNCNSTNIPTSSCLPVSMEFPSFGRTSLISTQCLMFTPKQDTVIWGHWFDEYKPCLVNSFLNVCILTFLFTTFHALEIMLFYITCSLPEHAARTQSQFCQLSPLPALLSLHCRSQQSASSSRHFFSRLCALVHFAPQINLYTNA